MKKFRKLLILSFVLTLLLGNLTVRVSAEDTTVPSQDETTVTTTDYSAEDEAEKRAREQQEALNAAVEEARRKAAEQTQQYQQEIDTQTYQSNDNVWQAIDEKIEPEDGRKKITTTTNSESVKKEDTDKEETVTEKAVKKEVAANVDLGGGSSIAVTTKYGSLSDNTVLSVTELGDSALLEFADRVGLANVVDGRYFVVNLLDENGESVTASRPLTVSLNSVDVNGELVNIYAANSETYELYAEGLTNNGAVDYTFETKDYDTFVILATGTKVEETTEPQATGLTSLLQNVPFLALFNKTEETETGLSGRTETSFTNDFVLNETEVETEGYPAFKATKTVTGTSMEVVVDAPAGAFPEGIQLYAEVVPTPQEVLDAIGNTEDEVLTLDVHFYLEENPDKEIEPNVPVSVTFNNIAVDSETVDVYHETEMIDTVNTDSATLELDGFSNISFIKSTKAPRLLGEENPTSDPAEGTDQGNSVSVTVVLNDYDNRDGYRQDKVTVSINSATGDLSYDFCANNENEETHSFEIPEGTVVDENSLTTPDIDQYTKTITGNSEEGFVITYKHIPEKYDSIPVTIVWDDDNDSSGKRPSTIYVRLYKEDGTYAGKQKKLTGTTSTTFTSGQKVDNYIFKKENGQPITYTVQETTNQAGDPKPLSDYYVEITGDAETGFTITNKLEKIHITAKASWNDDNNRDGLRKDVKLTLEGRTSSGTLISKTEQTHNIDVLPNFDFGLKSKYEGDEEVIWNLIQDSIDGYTTEIVPVDAAADSNNQISFTVTNTHEPKLLTIEATNTWTDNNDVDNIRPENIYVHVFRQLAGEEEYVGYLELNDGNEWNTSADKLQDNLLFVNAPVNQKYDYVFVESTEATQPESSSDKSGQPKDYAVDIVGTPSTDGSKISVAVKNAHEPYTRKIEVKKIWENENNDRSHRPDYVRIKLLEDGEYTGKHINLYSGVRWTGTFTVPVNKPIEGQTLGGELIEYSIEEVEVPFYYTDGPVGEMTEDFTKTSEFTITNKLIPNKTTVTINKVWEDENNADGKRPDVAYILLTYNGEIIKEARMREQDGWTVTFTEIPAYTDSSDPTNSIIDYKVEEDNNAGYKVLVEKDGNPSDGYIYTVTNVRQDIDLYSVDINVAINWIDDNNRDGLREGVTVRLLKDGQPATDEQGNPITLTLNEENEYSGVFADMPKYHPAGNTGSIFTRNKFFALPGAGEEIEYSIEVVNGAIDGYTGPTVSGNATDGFQIEYTHKPEIIDSISVTKVWNDAENQDGIRPETVYLRLYKADGTYMGKQQALTGDATEVTFTSGQRPDHFIYKYENGEEIEYTIVESASRGSEVVPVDGYEMTVEGNATDGFTVTNTHKPETVDINVTKVWDDDDNRDGVRPDAVYAVVYDGEGNKLRQRELSAANGWETTISAEKQYKYKPGEVGVPMKYTIEESWARGEVTPEDPKGNYTLESIEGDVENGFVITNKYSPERVNIKIEKTWMDEDGTSTTGGNNRDGKRPSEVTYVIFADGEEVDRMPIEVADDGSAEYEYETFKYRDGGIEINYTVVEEFVYPYEATYETEVIPPATEDDIETQLWTVTNTYDPERRTITVMKNWDDNNDQDGKRPDSVTVNLLADGQPALDVDGNPATYDLTAANGWAHNFTVWTNRNIDGTVTPIKYTVEELDVPEYEEPVYSDFADTGYITITNKHNPDTEIVVLIKEWKDENNKDGSRPESIIFNVEGYVIDLEETGARIHIPYDQSIIMMQDSLDNPNVWRKSIELEKYYNGQIITYLLTEEAVEGYTPDVPEVTIIAEDGTVVEEATITNTHTPEPVVIEGNVIWNDSNDQDGKRPDSVTVNLYADGEKIDSKTVTGVSNTWPYKFENLPKYSRGEVINYTVSETPIDDYAMRVQGYDITNSYTPGKTFLTIIKLWDDDRDRDGYRPDNCVVRLLADGEEVNRASLSEAQGWFTVFSDLPKMKDGKEITYTVEEDEIPEYKKEITGDQKKGYVIKNTHEPEKIDVVMKIRWFDDNNKLCKRPEKVKAHLLANGQGVVTKIFYAGEDWEDIVIKDLPKKAYGKEILYTISQKPLKDYETSNIGTTAYNKLEGCCKLCSDCKPVLPKTGVDAMPTYHNPNYLLLAK